MIFVITTEDALSQQIVARLDEGAIVKTVGELQGLVNNGIPGAFIMYASKIAGIQEVINEPVIAAAQRLIETNRTVVLLCTSTDFKGNVRTDMDEYANQYLLISRQSYFEGKDRMRWVDEAKTWIETQ